MNEGGFGNGEVWLREGRHWMERETGIGRSSWKSSRGAQDNIHITDRAKNREVWLREEGKDEEEMDGEEGIGGSDKGSRARNWDAQDEIHY